MTNMTIVLIVAALIAAGLLLIAGWFVYSVWQEYRRDRVPALLYHHFAPQGNLAAREHGNYDPVYFCYDTAFEAQVQYLHQQGYTTISLDDYVAFQQGKKPLPPKPIILTFDDGFMSNYLYAFPTLMKYGMTATIFVTVDPEAANYKKYAPVDLPLTHQQIKEMSDAGISIESHSMTHPYLSEMQPDKIRWELAESKKALEELLQKPVSFIAIPTGAYNRTVKRLVQETGYQAAFCMLKGTNNKHSDLYALRRLVVGRDFGLEDFHRMLQPHAACYLRLTSSIQNLLLFLLGPGGLDALRSRLYGSRLGTSIIRGQLRYLVPGFALALVLTLAVGLFIWRNHF